MDLSFLNEYIVYVDVAICLCVGYIIKKSLDFIPNKYIPLIVGVLGVIINVLSNLNNITVHTIAGGLVSGLASTGLYELFSKFIGVKDEADS